MSTANPAKIGLNEFIENFIYLFLREFQARFAFFFTVNGTTDPIRSG